ncbi:hypothetical protein [Cereibacter azotoformans]|uniref:hypothetical protein n=1 Tax=Cereibacter azotoformans TaxID=43057 RepID=UPI0015D5E634|nr:hypothetical protein [Cereibacter azotoformans]
MDGHIPRYPLAALAVALCAGLGGCTEQKTYPLSGSPCIPGDPVQSMHASDYAPPCP